MINKENQLPFERPRPQEGYWQEVFVVPIDYSVKWIDDKFESWLKRTFGSAKKFLDQIAWAVSAEATPRIAFSQPTGGRALTYNLKEPFIDPKFNVPCSEIDAKGVGLTKAGYLQFCYYFQTEDIPYREILISPDKDHEAWGPEGLRTAEAEVEDTQIVRRLGIITPYPGAVLQPKQFVLDGQKKTAEEIKKIFNLPPDDELAIIVRAHPITSTRISDLVDRVDLPRFEEIIDMPSKYVVPTAFRRCHLEMSDLINIFKKARQRWEGAEKPRLKVVFPGKDNQEFFALFYENILTQLTMMAKLGISPVTGAESKTQTCHHTSLHNFTTIGALVEWSPVTYIKKLEPKYQFLHMYELIQDIHLAVVVLGAACLADFQEIPFLAGFLSDLRKHVSSSLLAKIYDAFELSPEGIQALGNHDHLIEWLREYSKKIAD